MSQWLTSNAVATFNARTIPFDVRLDRQLRHVDIALSLLALCMIALPLALGLLLGRLDSVAVIGRQNQIFKRWRLRFPDNLVGRWLDRSTMAGWPVLVNILKGEMAWVGPRAISADSAEEYPPHLTQLRPGLVCIWDIRQRTAVDFGSRHDADLEYLRQRNVRHDLGLLLRAVLLFWMPTRREPGSARLGVGDVSFDNIDMPQALARISQMLDGDRAQQVSFVNPACVNIAAGDRAYRRLLARVALVLPDGIGIKIAADLLGVPLKQNVNGTDLFPRLCAMLERREASLFLLGGQVGVAEAVAEEIKQRWPGLRIAGLRDGFFSVAEEGMVAAQVRASRADVVLVARGVPMQDVFIDRHLHQLGVKVAIGVGGLFDFVSGRIQRAPTWMRDSGLEWIYRLLQEPARMWRRYLLGNFTFLGRIVLQCLGLRRAARDDLEALYTPQVRHPDASTGLRCVLFATATAPADVPVPSDYPAALLPLGWQSLAEHSIEQLARCGVRDIDLVVSSRPEALRALLGLGERWGVQLRWHLAKDAASPYAVLRAIGLAPDQRVLIGHVDQPLADRALAALIETEQVAASAEASEGVRWTGWASTRALFLHDHSLHSDERALGNFLCDRCAHLLVLEAGEHIKVGSAADLLAAQEWSLRNGRLAHLPATWVHTTWGAHSPDAVIQPRAILNGPVLIGPGCHVAAGATVGAGTVLTREVVVASGATLVATLVLPHTFVGGDLELKQTLVNGRTVQHLRLGVRTVLSAADGLLMDLRSPGHASAGYLSRGVALLVCLLLLPWLVLDNGLRRLRNVPPRWHQRLVALGRDADSGEVRLATLRCPRTSGDDAGHLLGHYGAWLDVMAGRRCWFGARPRSLSEWYALGRDWQLLLAHTPVGCLHAPAWSEAQGETLEARAAADVFLAVNPGLRARLRVILALLHGAVGARAKNTTVVAPTWQRQHPATQAASRS